ncbi:MAG: hypothetical protein Q8P67_26940, partial [archaeon]|nr:hypothetical protein [archaeon]
MPATEAALLLDGGLLPGQVAWNRRSWREAQADVQINFFSNLRREDEKTDLWTAFTIAQQDIPETLGKLPQEHLVLYIHGFNNRPSNPISMAHQLQAIFDAAGSHVRGKVLVVPFLWPCADNFVFERYSEDLRTANHVGAALGPWLARSGMFSAGNRVLTNAVASFPSIHSTAPHSIAADADQAV